MTRKVLLRGGPLDGMTPFHEEGTPLTRYYASAQGGALRKIVYQHLLNSESPQDFVCEHVEGQQVPVMIYTETI